MTEFIIIWLAALVMVMSMDNAYAEGYQELSSTITATVQNGVEVTDEGCFIDGAKVDCETLEPAGGGKDDE